MLTLKDIQAVNDAVMMDRLVIDTAFAGFDAGTIDERMAAAQLLAQMTIVVTIDKLSSLIKDIPSAADLENEIISKTINDLIASLDTNR